MFKKLSLWVLLIYLLIEHPPSGNDMIIGGLLGAAVFFLDRWIEKKGGVKKALIHLRLIEEEDE